MVEIVESQPQQNNCDANLNRRQRPKEQGMFLPLVVSSTPRGNLAGHEFVDDSANTEEETNVRVIAIAVNNSHHSRRSI